MLLVCSALARSLRYQPVLPHFQHASSRGLATKTPSVSAPKPIQHAISAAYYRGGTSRAVIIQPQSLPSDRTKWPSIFRQLMGSPDPYGRQLDGMGAGISSLSKICLVEARVEANGRPKELRRSGIDYTFVGLGIQDDEVDVAGNCGNMSSAIGPYAYNAGLLAPDAYKSRDAHVTVDIRNTNTGKYIKATFEVVAGQAAVAGDQSIDGVAGTGAPVKLDFIDPYGSKTAKVLPTGNSVDEVLGYHVSCVDGANPAVFVRADKLGIDGTILPTELNELPGKLELLERIRKAAAVKMGLAEKEDDVARTVPKMGIVSRSSTHKTLSGATLKNTAVDLVLRFISDRQPHRAIPLTAALTTAVAARIPGTVVEQLLAPDPVDEDRITIGHASGRIQVDATMDETGVPRSATVYRTARRIFEGQIYYTDADPASKGGEEGEEEGLEANWTKKLSLGLAFVRESRGWSSDSIYDDIAESLPSTPRPHPPYSYSFPRPAPTVPSSAQSDPSVNSAAHLSLDQPISWHNVPNA